MAVHVLIPVHNKIGITLACLEALSRQTYGQMATVIVDDGSTDGTTPKVNEEYPDVTVLHGDGNLWWTGAMKLGVEHVLAKAQPDDFILSLNNDTLFDENYVATLVEVSAENGRAIVGSFCREATTGDVIDAGSRKNWQDGTLTTTLDILDDALDTLYPFRVNNEEIPLETCLQELGVLRGFDYLYGRGTLIPVEVFEKVGNFDAKNFPHYGGDTEFFHRARTRGGASLVMSLRAGITNAETEQTTGIHHTDKMFMSLAQAWRTLWSIRSPLQISKGFRLINACCPRQYRLRNKHRLVARALRESFGKTLPGRPVVWLLDRLGHSVRRLKFLWRPVPIPAAEMMASGLDAAHFARNGALKRLRFCGRVYFKILLAEKELRDMPQGAALAELYRSSFRIGTKWRWLLRSLRKDR